MMSSSAGSTTSCCNEDLLRERERSDLDVERLTHVLDGGVDRTARRHCLQRMVERDPTGIFANDSNIYLHRTERHVRSMAKAVRLIELCRAAGIGGNDCDDGDILESPDFYALVNAVADTLPLTLHWVMFVPNIKSLFDEKQRDAILPLCRDFRMIGCYAQTELGHGSNIRALETTATFVRGNGGSDDDDDGHFVVHSPTLTSTKFWPGTLGRTANHAVVIARLIDGTGVDRGIHNFLVPIRSMADHSLLPGVTTGDVGPKLGYNPMDNGFARFDRVKIPRRNMAMRFATVDKFGNYRKITGGKRGSSAQEKVAYITMMQVRAFLCMESSRCLAQACTIAIRYSAVRRQGYDATKTNKRDKQNKKTNAASSELQVLDYQQQQYRLFTHLASSYCFFFVGRAMTRRIQQLETGGDKKITKAQAADAHASSSALKAYCTAEAADGMEDCRKACGGHGYLACSGLPELVNTFLMNPTVEGDNHMLPQQVIKVLLKLVRAVQQQQGQQEDDVVLRQYEHCDARILVPYLRDLITGDNNTNNKCAASNAEDLMNLDEIEKALRHAAARLLVEVAVQLQSSQEDKKMTPQEAWNAALVPMGRASAAYAQCLVLHHTRGGIEKAQERDGLIGAREANALQDLARLYGLRCVERDLGDYLQDGYLSSQQARWLRRNILESLLPAIRPHAVALTDARDFSDFVLQNSALGRYDGNVYPAIMEAARRDPLNRTDTGPGYDPHLKRLVADGAGVYNKNKNNNNNSYSAGTASRL